LKRFFLYPIRTLTLASFIEDFEFLCKALESQNISLFNFFWFGSIFKEISNISFWDKPHSCPCDDAYRGDKESPENDNDGNEDVKKRNVKNRERNFIFSFSKNVRLSAQKPVLIWEVSSFPLQPSSSLPPNVALPVPVSSSMRTVTWSSSKVMFTW
jgi:hypothetical protein